MSHTSLRTVLCGSLIGVALMGGGCAKEPSAPTAEAPSATTTIFTDTTTTTIPLPPTQATTTGAPAPKPFQKKAPTVTSGNTATTTATTKSITVLITNEKFSPQIIAANVGDTIVWVNKDTTPHTSVSDGTLLWDSGALLPGQSFRRTFKNPGSYAYHCGAHPNMTGTIIIR
jgi:plastocyanin